MTKGKRLKDPATRCRIPYHHFFSKNGSFVLSLQRPACYHPGRRRVDVDQVGLRSMWDRSESRHARSSPWRRYVSICVSGTEFRRNYGQDTAICKNLSETHRPNTRLLPASLRRSCMLEGDIDILVPKMRLQVLKRSPEGWVGPRCQFQVP